MDCCSLCNIHPIKIFRVLYFSTIDALGWRIPGWGSCSEHCRIFRNTPGLFRLYTISSSLLPTSQFVTTKKISLYIASCPLGTKMAAYGEGLLCNLLSKSDEFLVSSHKLPMNSLASNSKALTMLFFFFLGWIHLLVHFGVFHLQAMNHTFLLWKILILFTAVPTASEVLSSWKVCFCWVLFYLRYATAKAFWPFLFFIGVLVTTF